MTKRRVATDRVWPQWQQSARDGRELAMKRPRRAIATDNRAEWVRDTITNRKDWKPWFYEGGEFCELRYCDFWRSLPRDGRKALIGLYGQRTNLLKAAEPLIYGFFDLWLQREQLEAQCARWLTLDRQTAPLMPHDNTGRTAPEAWLATLTTGAIYYLYTTDRSTCGGPDAPNHARFRSRTRQILKCYPASGLEVRPRTEALPPVKYTQLSEALMQSSAWKHYTEERRIQAMIPLFIDHLRPSEIETLEALMGHPMAFETALDDLIDVYDSLAEHIDYCCAEILRNRPMSRRFPQGRSDNPIVSPWLYELSLSDLLKLSSTRGVTFALTVNKLLKTNPGAIPTSASRRVWAASSMVAYVSDDKPVQHREYRVDASYIANDLHPKKLPRRIINIARQLIETVGKMHTRWKQERRLNELHTIGNYYGYYIGLRWRFLYLVNNSANVIYVRFVGAHSDYDTITSQDNDRNMMRWASERGAGPR
jgi:hypothetical protein